jgi:hypothetical protein
LHNINSTHVPVKKKLSSPGDRAAKRLDFHNALLYQQSERIQYSVFRKNLVEGNIVLYFQTEIKDNVLEYPLK